MKTSALDIFLAKALGLTAFLTTITVMTNLNSDPVNAPKLAVLGILGTPIIFASTYLGLSGNLKSHKYFFWLISIFVFLLLINLVTTTAPISQVFYGVYGRNTGVLAYLLFAGLALGASLLNQKQSIAWILKSLLAAGAINLLYSYWVMVFGDFVQWNNPYKTILGTFGNPNFISSFLAICSVVLASLFFKKNDSRIVKILLLVGIFLSFGAILHSKSVQGIALFGGGIAIVLFYAIRAKYNSKTILSTYSFLVSLSAGLAVLGTLQKGPLTFIYEKSVSFRGSYWRTALDIGAQKPLTGVGMDSYGNWYRRSRPDVALVDTPGINTTADASHNVILDMFAGGGAPLLISYLSILFCGLWAIIRITKRNREYDALFTAITSAWACYQAQSIISINQIGLAQWGWILTGLLIGYERFSRDEESGSTPQAKARLSTSNLTSITALGLVMGIILSLPPVTSDMKWSRALKSQQLQQVEMALIPSFFNPPNSTKFNNTVNLMLVNKLNDKALYYAEKAVKFNPDNFDSWKQLYFIAVSSDRQRALALQNMKRLDPKNPDVTAPR